MASIHYLLILQTLLGSVIGELQIAPELFLNKLNISYGINYKYNGQLNHNIDRVWVVTKVKIPKYEEIRFPNISFDPNCNFLDSLRNGNTQTQVDSIKQLCRDSAPLLHLFQYKENYKKELIQKLLNEDLRIVLKGKRLRSKRSRTHPRVPKSSEPIAQNSSNLNMGTGSTDEFSNTSSTFYPYRGKRGFAALVPALAGLATITVESIGSFLQKKRNKALEKGLKAIKSDQDLTWNSIRQLEDDFLLYGKYNLDSLEKIIHTVNHLGDRAHQMEGLLMGKDHSVATRQFLHSNYLGRLLFAHKLNIYLTSVQETQLRLYDELERVLKEFLSAVEILSRGYLPASLFPPSTLRRITSNALQMVQKKNPDYILTIKHVTEYYDMKMVTFGVNDGEELLVAFPVFVQDHTRESMTLYELETVKVPITYTNLAANSCTEVETSKPYIAFSHDYYIQLRTPELHMYKQIWHSYYCEELFLVKHKSKHSCESAIYYNLSKEVINDYCTFKYFYNTTVMPSVLDGGPQILLANLLTPKRLICTYASDMARPVPSHDYVLVSRSMLCNCHMESGLTYLLKSIAFCEDASTEYTMSFALNLAFLHLIQELWPGNFSMLPSTPTSKELSFPLGLTSNSDFLSKNPNSSYPLVLRLEPKSLKALRTSLKARNATVTNKKIPFSFGPRQDYPIGLSEKGSFLFHLALHIFYFTTGVIVFASIGPQIYACIKQGKLKTLVTAMALHKLPGADSLIPNEGHAKYVCLDPWVNALVTLASLGTIATYLIVRCRRRTLCKGLKYTTAYHIYVFISSNDRYSPIKLRSATGLLYNFVTNQGVPMEALELHKGCPWDNLSINWGKVTLANGDTQIRLPYNIQVPMKEKARLRSLMKSPDCTAHLMVLQGHTWYTVGTTPLHYPAAQQPLSPGSINPLPTSSEDFTA